MDLRLDSKGQGWAPGVYLNVNGSIAFSHETESYLVCVGLRFVAYVSLLEEAVEVE
jgi:hypothetical protein